MSPTSDTVSKQDKAADPLEVPRGIGDIAELVSLCMMADAEG